MKVSGLGVMIGSSLDGLDLANCQFEIGEQNDISNWELISYSESPLTDSIRNKIKTHDQLSKTELTELETEIAELVIQTVNNQSDLSQVGFLAYHGITIKHFPEQQISVQLGDAQLIADKIGIDVISDFRQADMEAGGMGTPMVPIVEKYLFSDYDYFLNLGGIANFSDHTQSEIIAFDVCPFNQVVNHFAKQSGFDFDKGGVLASKGIFQQSLYDELYDMPFFKIQGPKAIDNNWIVHEIIPLIESFKLRHVDVLNTFSSLVVDWITKVCNEGNEMRRMMVTGGGAYNTHFVNQLRLKLKSKNVELVIPENVMVNAKEAILMALAGLLRISNIPNFIPSVTGAQYTVSGGQIYKPK